MVDATVRFLKYWPLAALGRARLTASTSAARLSEQHGLLEAGLAEGDMDDAALVHLELHAAGLDLRDRALEVEGDGARLRVRHQAAPAEDAAQLADHAHHVGRRERDVELEVAGLDLLDEILAADLVRAGAERLLRLVALGEHEDADGLAHAVRQDDGAADHLVRVAGIDAEADVGLDGRVELDLRGLLEQVDRLLGLVGGLAVDELDQLVVALAVLGMGLVPPLRPGRASPWRRGVDVPAAADVAPAPAAGTRVGC